MESVVLRTNLVTGIGLTDGSLWCYFWEWHHEPSRGMASGGVAAPGTGHVCQACLRGLLAKQVLVTCCVDLLPSCVVWSTGYNEVGKFLGLVTLEPQGDSHHPQTHYPHVWGATGVHCQHRALGRYAVPTLECWHLEESVVTHCGVQQ